MWMHNSEKKQNRALLGNKKYKGEKKRVKKKKKKIVKVSDGEFSETRGLLIVALRHFTTTENAGHVTRVNTGAISESLSRLSSHRLCSVTDS